MVLVVPGTYMGKGNINLDFEGKSIKLTSLYGPQVTVLDCANEERGVTFWSDEDSTSILNGFTIINGARLAGGGIYIEGSSPTIRNCMIINCSADDGGGIFCDFEASPIIENCTLSNNSANNLGGGFYCHDDSSPTLKNLTITGNTAQKDGGGVFCGNNSNPNLQNVTITYNSAIETGGGIYLRFQSDAIMTNVLISKNTVGGSGGGIRLLQSNPLMSNLTISKNIAENGGGMILAGSNPKIINSIIWDNGSGGIYFSTATGFESSVLITHSDIQDGEGGIITNDNGEVNWLEGNIALDPLLNSNYTLKTDSPCINSGSSFFVWQGDTLINMMANDYYGSAPDMGATGFSCSSEIGDINNDGTWNVLDVVDLGNCVMTQNCLNLLYSCAGDLNGDGTYNVLDIVTLANCVLAQNCGG